MLVRQDFGPEGAAYVRAYLESSRRLGKRFGRLLARRDIEAGTTWAFVPPESSLRQRFDLEHGGLYPDSGPPMRAEKGWLVPTFDPSSDPQITAALADLLDQPRPPRRLICVEHAYARPTDPWLAERPLEHVFFCGDDVYTYGTVDTPIKQVMGQLRGATWKPNVGIVTALPGGLDLTDRAVSPEALEAMAAAAILIIVGAWDAEGLLFLAPRR